MSALEQARQARERFRAGERRPTAGLAPGMTQANLIALPRDWAWDFLLYAQRNPQASPVLEVSDPGDWRTVLAEGADLRTDLPRYRLWRDGVLIKELDDARPCWEEHPDLITFLIGCSFTFESALIEAGIEVRHITDNTNVPMYRTTLPCRPAGRLRGEVVVSMRPLPAAHIARASTITARYPGVHGAPIHVGDPGALGIRDIDQPDFGDPVRIEPGEIPVFWACGVTPQAAVMASNVPFALTHAPGHMFITDVPGNRYHV
ncbi:putative hydro-lyase [Kushneria phyllosphaerae]|uniref:Putative hydro-lyase KSP9073_00550 n=1 Tax=Kushneria phyllosphaerae TaxID=2100822 RepID=A0A2R8CI36_9GAMM|nr:putative hydro-lyase [Kushneria phyllosphaerae]SPJ32549.1 hypothetical protein KSP9073_00550 [Kushneria phyllosphaerae]